MREEDRGDERIKYVESLYRGTLGTFLFVDIGACATRADKGEWSCRRMREKIAEWKMNDMWLLLIDCLDFSHFNNLNSFILLQNNYFNYLFFTKIHDFFSLPIETWII